MLSIRLITLSDEDVEDVEKEGDDLNERKLDNVISDTDNDV